MDEQVVALDVSADDLYALIGRQLVEISLLRKLLAEAGARGPGPVHESTLGANGNGVGATAAGRHGGGGGRDGSPG